MEYLSAEEEAELAIFPYIKLRKEFGRQPRFIPDRTRVHCNILSNRTYRQRFHKYRLLYKEIQACKPFSETAMNTPRTVKTENGMVHIEGGWPKEIRSNDSDMVLRHRKKLEKEETYQTCVPHMMHKIVTNVKQNNAVDLYEEYFDGKWKHPDPYKRLPHAKTVLIFEDPSYYQRAVKKIIWAPGNVGRMGVCHAPARYTAALREAPTEAYFWDVEIASRPESQVRSFSHIMDIMYHPKDVHSVCGGCFDGTVQHWDSRVGANPIGMTSLELGHQDVCTGVSWVNSKTNSEFLSTGLDGQVIWWDIRNLEEQLESAVLDPEKGKARPEAALRATCLEYEHTVPTKYIVGTENGRVMVMLRKGKTPNDRLFNIYKAHRSPVIYIKRNPTFVKNFLTVAGTTVRIFSEDCRDSATMWTAPKNVLYTHASWVPSRPSQFVATRNDGYFDIYDILKDPARPYTVVKVRSSMDNKKKPKRKYKREVMEDLFLTYGAACGAPSKLLAIGSSRGNIYMQKLSESLYMSEKSDKPILAHCFEREVRREKFIEQRYREIRLRKRDRDKMADIAKKISQDRIAFAEKLTEEARAEGRTPEIPDYSKNPKYDIEFEVKHTVVHQVEREFYLDLEREIEEKGIDAWIEYANMVKAEKKHSVEAKDIEEALDVTAADLAAFENMDDDDDDYDDNGRPIPKKPTKIEAPPPVQPPPVAATLPPASPAPAPPAAEVPGTAPQTEAQPKVPDTPAPVEPSTEGTPAVTPSTTTEETPAVTPSTTTEETPAVAPSTTTEGTPAVAPSTATEETPAPAEPSVSTEATPAPVDPAPNEAGGASSVETDASEPETGPTAETSDASGQDEDESEGEGEGEGEGE